MPTTTRIVADNQSTDATCGASIVAGYSIEKNCILPLTSTEVVRTLTSTDGVWRSGPVVT
jgi:hypothetical protein